MPELKYEVVLGNGHIVAAYTSGKLRKNYIKMLPGDKILVELSPYDLGKGRITRRLWEWNVFGWDELK